MDLDHLRYRKHLQLDSDSAYAQRDPDGPLECWQGGENAFCLRISRRCFIFILIQGLLGFFFPRFLTQILDVWGAPKSINAVKKHQTPLDFPEYGLAKTCNNHVPSNYITAEDEPYFERFLKTICTCWRWNFVVSLKKSLKTNDRQKCGTLLRQAECPSGAVKPSVRKNNCCHFKCLGCLGSGRVHCLGVQPYFSLFFFVWWLFKGFGNDVFFCCFFVAAFGICYVLVFCSLAN